MAKFSDIDIDASVVARAQAGHRPAAETLCRALAPAVYTVCFRLTQSEALAEDLVQESFIDMLRSLPGFRGDAALTTWVRKIAVSRCMMHFRSAWQRRSRPLDDAMLSELSAVEQDAGLARDLEGALARLPEAARIVVWLYDVEGYTHKEIAELTGRTVSYSKSCLSRAHRLLRDWLEPEPTAIPDRATTTRCLA